MSTQSIPSHMMVHKHINIALNGSQCPGAGFLGECPATYLSGAHSGACTFVSEIYLWPAGDSIKPSDIIAWAALSGISPTEMTLEQVLHDGWNSTQDGRTLDNCRHFRLTFSTSIPDSEHCAYLVAQAANQLLYLANETDNVVTIERMPLKPLAMGNACYQVDVRPARSAS